MKKSKFTEAQTAFALKQAEDGTAVGEVYRKGGISEATFQLAQAVRWLDASEMKRLRQLEENGKLKRMVVASSIDFKPRVTSSQ